MYEEIYLTGNPLFLDLETTNTQFGDPVVKENNLLLSAWCFNGEWKYSYGNEYNQDSLLKDIEKCDYVVAHHAAFELGWLKRCGIDLHKVVVFDTMIAENVLLGNVRKPLTLEAISKRRGLGSKNAYVDICMKKKVCPSVIPKSKLRDRCLLDVKMAMDIHDQQKQELQERGLLPVFYTRCLVTPALVDIQANGLYLDREKVESEHNRARLRQGELLTELHTLSGTINYNSPKQLGELLYDKLEFAELTSRRGEVIRTDSGGRKTDVATLSKLKATTPEQEKFLSLFSEYSAVEAELSKALSKFKECCDEGDLLYARFNQCVTQTHRLSSSGTKYKTQFQNLARKFKPLFKSRNTGWLMGEADGAQLEFRVAAFLGQDEVAMHDIRNEVDVHVFTRDTITNAGQTINRQEAKAHTFKPLTIAA